MTVAGLGCRCDLARSTSPAAVSVRHAAATSLSAAQEHNLAPTQLTALRVSNWLVTFSLQRALRRMLERVLSATGWRRCANEYSTCTRRTPPRTRHTSSSPPQSTTKVKSLHYRGGGPTWRAPVVHSYCPTQRTTFGDVCFFLPSLPRFFRAGLSSEGLSLPTWTRSRTRAP